MTIRVADTGPGVPEKARAQLFRAFQGSVSPGGTGLGLAIAAELVRAHGGTIALVDGGPGATFAIAIPDRPRANGRNGRWLTTPTGSADRRAGRSTLPDPAALPTCACIRGGDSLAMAAIPAHGRRSAGARSSAG